MTKYAQSTFPLAMNAPMSPPECILRLPPFNTEC
jgi:hypothetical protein